MKNFVLIVALIAGSKNLSAQINQTDWQWRTDKSIEKNVKPLAAINVPISAVTANQGLRIRFKIVDQDAASSTAPLVSILDDLEYTTNPDNSLSWLSVGTVIDGTVPFVMQGTSVHVTQDDPTTSNQLGAEVNPYVPGIYMVKNTTTNGVNISPSTFTEIEWAIIVTTSALPGTKYYFRESGTTNCCNLIISKLAALTMTGVLPVKLTSFNVTADAKKVKLDWSTAMELNNDHFEILRSNDGKTWESISSVKGHGTTSLTNNYKIYDESPLSGINYYKIKQLDIDGKISLSEMKAIKFQAGVNSVLKVSPNPAHGNITYSTTNTYKNVEVTLTNVNGGIISQEIITTVNAGAINKLKLQKAPVAGMYILTLKSADLFETSKVMVN